MRFPTRAESHVAETASFKRLDRCIPDHWIVRHASERDYGIDCLIEPVVEPGGQVKGDLLAVQMKSIQEIAWNGTGENAEATFSGIKAETVNYWMRLPVPVFLCVHDRKTDEVFYARVKRQVRHRYQELQTQDTFGFRLSRKFVLDLSTASGKILFLFSRTGTGAASFRPRHDGADRPPGSFRTVHSEQHPPGLVHGGGDGDTRAPLHFHQTVATVAWFSGIDWDVPSMDDFVREDQRLFKHDRMAIHERTHDNALYALAPIFLKALRNGCEIVGEHEFDYWYERDPILAQLAGRSGSTRGCSTASIRAWHS